MKYGKKNAKNALITIFFLFLWWIFKEND